MGFDVNAPKGANRRKIIMGRGKAARRGRACGRGHNGQNARAGGGVRPGFEGGQMPLYRRIAVRGFSNYPFKKELIAINLKEIERKYEDGEIVSQETLKKKGVLKGKNRIAKILSDGEITKKLTFQGIAVSKKAIEKIEASGGNIVETGKTNTGSASQE